MPFRSTSASTTLLSLPYHLYTEFGLRSLITTGRDAYLIILSRTTRMLAYSSAGLIIALHFSALGFSDQEIGAFMTLTLLGDVLLSLVLSLVADRLGRRRILLGGAVLMVVSGFAFVWAEKYWVLLLAAVVGVVSASGGDMGPFRAIEESVLSGITAGSGSGSGSAGSGSGSGTRSDVLSWYVTASSLGSAVGTELAGRIVEWLRHRDGWTVGDAYHTIFWGYIVMGGFNVGLTLLMSEACELSLDPLVAASRESKTENEAEEASSSEHLLHNNNNDDNDEDDEYSDHRKNSTTTTTTSSPRTGLFSSFSQISSSTLKTMSKLWFLLVADSTADGMVSYSLTTYYLDTKFSLPRSTLGDITSISYLLASLSTLFAAPLAKRLGLINTMVFTHVPSSLAVLLFPFPGNLWLTVILFFIRTGLNNMDQAPRTAFIAAVVRPEERTAVMGITSMLRTLASAGGPFITGVLAEKGNFWIAFMAAGCLRLSYDLGLWWMFRLVDVGKVEEEKGSRRESRRKERDEEEHGSWDLTREDEIELVGRRDGYSMPETPGSRTQVMPT